MTVPVARPGSGVPAPPVVEAHAQHVREHADGVADRRDATVLFVLPAQRYHTNGEPETTGQVQDLDVEAEAIDALATEHGPRRVRPEGFETALRILDARHRQRLDHPIEHAAHDVPIARF